MRHPELGDSTIEALNADQVAVHEENGWVVYEPADEEQVVMVPDTAAGAEAESVAVPPVDDQPIPGESPLAANDVEDEP